MGPVPVVRNLVDWGVSAERCVPTEETWVSLAQDLRVLSIAAAHLQYERDDQGNSSYVGYVLAFADRKVYFAGDTCVTQDLIDGLRTIGPLNMAVLPVNEHNFFRGRRGIVGNMSVREAFLLAQEVGIQTVVPVHWDMFEVNSVSPAEIRAVYEHMRPGFSMRLQEEVIEL
jgi:L-ascorbate metabolism protein UlaG (beta-lactamase superfamily)